MWHNYGDVNFMQYGGCLVKEDFYPDCFHVIWLLPEICNYSGKYKKPVIVAKCFVNLADWVKPEVNKFSGYSEDYVPESLEEKMLYCTDLIDYYGIQEFEPTFPNETDCTCHSLGTSDQWIVGVEIAKKFMRNYGVPLKYRK